MSLSQLTHLQFAADAQFWRKVAAWVARAAGSRRRARDFHHVHVVLPNWTVADAFRAALSARCASGLLLPRCSVWSELGSERAGGARSPLVRRTQVFAALRANSWVRTHLGTQPQALWALADQIEQLGDELTYAALGDLETLPQRIEGALARHYTQRAARALMPQAQLVLALWRAGGNALAADRVEALNRLADEATGPLVFVAGLHTEPWVQAWLARHAQHAPVVWIEADAASVVRSAPLLAAAWPERARLPSEATEVPDHTALPPLKARADALRVQVPVPKEAQRHAVKILRATSLEEEATAIAHQVLSWLRDGVGQIALVVLDRLTARRVRALLERAQVLVRDETGWKLSTTSAAAALMRWYDLVTDDLYWRDILDWLKSTFTLANRPHKAEEVALLERAIRASGALQGARSMEAALAAYEGSGDAETGPAQHIWAGALEILALIDSQTQWMRRADATLSGQLNGLQHALDTLGMRSALAADPVGVRVLEELDVLEQQLAGATERVQLSEFRALLAARFEQATYVDDQITSLVAMVSLSATPLRAFDAVCLIGADADRLPAASDQTLFMTHAVRRELGLSTSEEALEVQSECLALLLANVPQVVATWRAQVGDEPKALSALLERLSLVAQWAWDLALIQPVMLSPEQVQPLHSQCPQPSAPALLPQRLSASQTQSLVHCAYQFYARCLLKLETLEDVIEEPDKREFGQILHAVLNRFHTEWGREAFHECDAAELEHSLRAHAQEIFAPQIERAPGLLAYACRFDSLVDGYVQWLQASSQEGWRWHAGEVAHQCTLTLTDGQVVTLVGRVDHIDTNAHGQSRLIDYKAKRVDALNKKLKQPGEDIQLPFYGMLLASQHIDSAAYVSFDRGKEDEPGVQVVAPPTELPFSELVAQVADRLHEDLQSIADGAPLPAIGVESACQYCEMRGLCRRDYWIHTTQRKNGQASTSTHTTPDGDAA